LVGKQMTSLFVICIIILGDLQMPFLLHKQGKHDITISLHHFLPLQLD